MKIHCVMRYCEIHGCEYPASFIIVKDDETTFCCCGLHLGGALQQISKDTEKAICDFEIVDEENTK